MIKRSRFPNFISRKEIKLRLDKSHTNIFLREVDKHLPVYCYAPGREITFVTTIYFDTQDLRFFNRANKFRHDNLKIRLKEYYYEIEAGKYEIVPECWVEIKRRLGDSTSKHRFKIVKNLVNDLFNGADLYNNIIKNNQDLSPTDIKDIYNEFKKLVTTHQVIPYSSTNYRRRTYQEKGNESLRITFDDMIQYFKAPTSIYNGRAALTRNELGPVCGHQEHTVIEIKTTKDFPVWLRKLLRMYPQSNFSKFLSSTRTLIRTPPASLPINGERSSSSPEESKKGSSIGDMDSNKES